MMELLLPSFLYALIGSFAGLLAGILGVGGGIIIVPGLLFIFQINKVIPMHMTMHVAEATSLAIMMFTSQASLLAHYRLGEILWPVFKILWPGAVIGTFLGAMISGLLPTAWLKILFAVFLLLVALKMLMDMLIAHSHSFSAKPWLHRLVSFFVGLQSGLLGVGGGIFIVPYLTYCGVPIRKIASLSNLCAFTVALSGTLIFMFTGGQEMEAIPYSTGYVYWPAVLGIALPGSLFAPLGAKLSYHIPIQQLQYGFIILLSATAMYLFF